MADSEIIKTLLLLALPASGKSELRRYLGSLEPDECRQHFHIGPTVQLDDYPWVELFIGIDQAALKIGLPCIFFQSPGQPLKDQYDWLTLIELLNQDYLHLVQGYFPDPSSPALYLFDRIDQAQLQAGAKLKLGRLLPDIRELLARYAEKPANKIMEYFHGLRDQDLRDKTVVIEFARGGPNGPMPLDPPHGYFSALSRLSPQILHQAHILYVKVDPAESRAKDLARAVPPPGVEDTGIYHGAGLPVLLADYACCDMAWLLEQSGQPNLVRIPAHGRVFDLPTTVFVNDDDLTTQLRQPPETWNANQIRRVHDRLKLAMGRLVQ